MVVFRIIAINNREKCHIDETLHMLFYVSYLERVRARSASRTASNVSAGKVDVVKADPSAAGGNGFFFFWLIVYKQVITCIQNQYPNSISYPIAFFSLSLSLSAAGLVDKEEREIGAVRGDVYTKYINSSNAWHLFFVSVLWIFCYMAGTVSVSFWVVLWTNSVDENNEYTYQSGNFFMAGYALIYVFVAIFAYLR